MTNAVYTACYLTTLQWWFGGGGGPEGLDPLPPPKYMYQTKEFV